MFRYTPTMRVNATLRCNKGLRQAKARLLRRLSGPLTLECHNIVYKLHNSTHMRDHRRRVRPLSLAMIDALLSLTDSPSINIRHHQSAERGYVSQCAGNRGLWRGCGTPVPTTTHRSAVGAA